jgi:hypothetical protein
MPLGFFVVLVSNIHHVGWSMVVLIDTRVRRLLGFEYGTRVDGYSTSTAM